MSLGILASRFTPKRLNVTAWLDASDPAANGTLPTLDSALASWVDKSGNGHNAAQASSGLRPLYTVDSSKSAIKFNGTDQYLTIPYSANLNAASMSIYIVCSVLALPPSFGEIISSVDFGATMEGYTPLVDNAGDWNWYVGNGTGVWNVIAGNACVVDERVLLRCYLNKATDPFVKNGTAFSGNSTDYVPNASRGLFIGCATSDNFFINCLINEIQIYNYLHTTAQAAQVAKYLTDKWGGGIS